MIEVKITGLKEVLAHLRSLPDGIHTVVGQSVGRIILKLTRMVKQDKLTGQALHVRTGRLRRSIHPELEISDDEIVGTVGTNVEYAAVHEYGFSGTESVKAHLRTIKQAFGRAISPVQISVAAHSRRVTLPRRSFLGSALNELRPQIEPTITEAVNRALARGSK